MSDEPEKRLPQVTVVIPTLADSKRRASLLHAIDSVTSQSGVDACPLVVINGDRYDRGLRALLESREDLSVVYQERGSLPLAISTGRANVRTEFFSYLDDDDEYIPDTLCDRVAPMLADQRIDAVVSNGYRKFGDGSSTAYYQSGSAFSSDPLGSLIELNWLASCGGTFRTAGVAAEVFGDVIPYYEWTGIAFKLALSGARIEFLDDKTFSINDTAESLSSSESFAKAGPQAMELLLQHNPPRRIARHLRRKINRQHHYLSAKYLTSGRKDLAWKHHFRSLGSIYGFFQYFLYTRHLI